MNYVKYIQLIMLFFCVFDTMNAKNNASLERTFMLIKPHAVEENKTDEIIDRIKAAGFTIVVMKKMTLTSQLARQLYKEHRHSSWFNEYIRKMTASPVVAMVLEKNNAMDEWDRYKKVIRAMYMSRPRYDVVHGSDSLKAAQREIALFFSDL